MKSNEIWKDIPNYEGLYQVSNLGKIKSLLFNKEKILKTRLSKKGYELVKLVKDFLKKLQLLMKKEKKDVTLKVH